MSYQVLARKWRPKNFKELMGQEHVVTVLTNALKQQRIHHAYLFTGTRGVGKTTIARIFAKSLNCHQGVTDSPCGHCEACVDIDQGRFVDLLEIDAASRTKVDDTREILDNVQYAPTRGRYKVYLIDEVHMLSRSSFNALLKTLEEPPEHVKFILATTDPQKLPVTVLSRCLQFHLKALSVSQIERQLKTILEAEEVGFEALALTLLAKAARGSMRDSLSLTDQAIAQGQGNISVNNVQQMLGGVDHNWIYNILILLFKNDSNALMAMSLDIASYAPNYGRLMADLLQLLHQIAMSQMVDVHFELPPEHQSLLKKFCQAASPEDIQLYYQIVLNCRKDLPYAADEQAAFDMMLLRLLAFKPQVKGVNAVENVQTNVSNDLTLSLIDTSKATEPETNIEGISSPVEDNQPATTQEFTEKTSHIEHQPHDVEVSALLAKQQHELEHTAEQMLAEPISNEVQMNASTSESISDKNIAQAETEKPQRSNIENSDEMPTAVQQKAPELEALNSNKDNIVTDEPIAKTGIESVLASRNMLRSRKKRLENSEKKSNDADERQKNQVITKPKPDNVPDISTISEQPFTPDVIDPKVVKKANQVDKWANMIDAMALNGRLRQIALNSIIGEDSTQDSLVLLLNKSTKHLKSDVAHQQLEQFVSEYFEKDMQVEIRIVEETSDDPTQIQGHINDKRYSYAKELLFSDEVVIALQRDFQAELDEKTIVAR